MRQRLERVFLKFQEQRLKVVPEAKEYQVMATTLTHTPGRVVRNYNPW